MEIKAPRLSKKDIKARAEEFLAKFNSKRKFPLQIELIAEEQGIKISPLQDLKKITGAEGFIKPDLTEIGIDFDIYFNYENRARFTIAHEVGHWFLHKDIYSKIAEELELESFFDYAKFIEKIPSSEYDWIEWHSYFFAGQILVPEVELRKKAEEMLGDWIGKTTLEDILFPIIEELALFFKVSSQVVKKRLNEERLIRNRQRSRF